MTFKDLVNLYEKKKEEVDVTVYKYVSELLKEAKRKRIASLPWWNRRLGERCNKPR